MKTLAQALSGGGSAGLPLPEILPILTHNGITPRRGQVMVIAAPPNGGKSLLALWYAVQHNLPTLYFSADTDDFTTINRAGAMLTGKTVREIETQVETGGGPLIEDEFVDRLDNVRFLFNPSPTMDDIELEMLAFTEMWGEPPHLTIIDNLMNVVAETDNEFAGMRAIMSSLHHLARVTESGVWVLHHVSEAEGRPNKPAPRRAVMGKVNQLPEMILTVATEPMASQFHVACVKNRSGPHDATGDTFYTVPVDFDRMTIYVDQQAKVRADAWRGYE